MLSRRAALGASLLLPSMTAQAQVAGFPNRPVRIVVPYPPGGPNDLVARAIARGMSERWDKPVVVENRPGGAAGVVGTELVARSEPDGHTLVLNGITHAIAPGLYSRLPYDTAKDFTAVSLVGWAPLMLVVHPSIPVTSVAELIAYAKARPGQLSYASTGNGTSIHLATEMFKRMAGLDILHVPYRGSSQAITGLVANEVQLMIEAVPSAWPHAREGRLRALAVTSLERWPALPELPTIAESGLPSFDAGIWWGVLGPAKLPAPILAELNKGVNAALQEPEAQQALGRLGIQPIGTTPEAFEQRIRDDMARFATLIREAGIRPPE
jgi:tripartite-type tricarboxylate transporter receptor subunit TctC